MGDQEGNRKEIEDLEWGGTQRQGSRPEVKVAETAVKVLVERLALHISWYVSIFKKKR